MNPNRIKVDRVNALLEHGVEEGVFPGAVLLVARKGQILFLKETGHLSLIPDRVSIKRDTVFDLASLTKPLATTLSEGTGGGTSLERD